ncbi:MAG TPA: glycoside hydrolase family 88 protein [Verrucomicrobiae bacterium]|jgi:rhamnogalacturonyl hydrolase YesR|nr:glycoside hydrolase family 88 protein [Verrucomicrobiae bacterium]
MKKIPAPLLSRAALGLLLMATAPLLRAQDASKAPAESTITDAQIRDVISRVAKHQIHALADGEYPTVTNLDQAKAAKAPEGIVWNYPWGVALYGVIRSTDVTGDKEAEKFVLEHDKICARYYQWLAGLEKQFGNDGKTFARTTKLKPLINLGNLDSCGSMGNQIVETMLRHPELVTPADKEIAARVVDWVANKQERLPDGTLSRGKQSTVWPDDLYMGCPVIIRWSEFSGDKKYLDDAANQITHQAELEQDADGLFFHGYDAKAKKHSPFKWGRGNGWVTVAAVELLSALPEDHPARAKVIAILKKQIDGLQKVQAPDGMWRQVLDHPELWEETSCTAMFAYGIARAVNRGWINASYLPMARKAFAGISKNVTTDGVVNETCIGTNIGQDLDYYVNRQRPSDDPHGRGPVLLAGTEILVAKQK